jgi:hypothetical protein
MKMKLKMTTAILMSLFLVGIIAVSTHAKPAEPSRMLMVDIIAKGDDADILGATTFIQGKIEFDKDSGVPLGRVEFHIKIYDESGEKIYSMMGKLKNGMVIPGFYFDCSVRHVRWINLWFVMGEGMIKTPDKDLEIEYRGQLITLPNTGGKWLPVATITMMVSPEGEYIEIPGGEDIHGFYGGWVAAGIMGFDGIEMFGGVTYLTKYMEKWVP